MTDDYMRPALDVLAELDRRKAQREMTQKLHEVVAAVKNTGKKGKLVIELTIEPVKNAEDVVDVTHVIVAKSPVLQRPPSRFFLTDDNNLTRDDPQQETLGGPIASVPTSDSAAADRKAN